MDVNTFGQIDYSGTYDMTEKHAEESILTKSPSSQRMAAQKYETVSGGCIKRQTMTTGRFIYLLTQIYVHRFL